MDNNRNYKELDKILAQQGVQDNDAKTMADDIGWGDELLDQFAPAKVDSKLLDKIENDIHHRLQSQPGWRFGIGRIMRIAAMVTLLLAGSWAIMRNNNVNVPQETTIETESDIDIWELALLEVDEAEGAFDDYALDEIMILMGDDFDGQIDTIFGKEYPNETYNHYYVTSNYIT